MPAISCQTLLHSGSLVTTYVPDEMSAHQPDGADAAANSLSRTVLGSPDGRNGRWMSSPSTNHCLDGFAGNQRNTGAHMARWTLIRAITRYISDKRFNAAQAALVLQLTGRQVTDLLNENVDTFTIDELIDLLPLVGLSIQVVPESRR